MDATWDIGTTPVNLLGNQLSGNEWTGTVPRHVILTVVCHTYSKGKGLEQGDKFEASASWTLDGAVIGKLETLNLFRLAHERDGFEDLTIRPVGWQAEATEAVASATFASIEIPKGATLTVKADSRFGSMGAGINPGNCVIRIDVNAVAPDVSAAPAQKLLWSSWSTRVTK